MASALDSPDDMARLRAVRRAGIGGEAGLVEKLIDMALHDDTDVRVEGGMAETYENIADAAAGSLARILGRQAGIDPRIEDVARDLSLGDDRVANLLYFLGARYEPLRSALASSPEGRLRLRAAQAVLSIERT